MKPLVPLRAALTDPYLLAPVMGGESREPMRALLLASQGEALTEPELAYFRELTGRDSPLPDRAKELHVFAGRRSGKSSGCAALAVYCSALCDHSDRLAAGERGVALLVAENQKQAKVLLNYVAGTFDSSAALAKLVVNRTQTSLSLSNRVEIEVRSADFRGLRGLTLICAIGDEICHWRSDYSANPAEEIITAIRPGLVTTQGQLITIGSPYAKSGFGYATWRRHFGAEGDPRILVATGATRTFNSTIPQEEIDRAVEEDPAAAASEWLGQWRADIEAFISREVVEAVVIPDRFELPRVMRTSYVAFCDPSGGSSDDMTLAIAHREGELAILDCLRTARPPFNPDEVTREFAQTLRSYGLVSVKGDRYGGEWPAQRFRAHGISYVTKNEIYTQALPLLMGRRVELLDNAKLQPQLIGIGDVAVRDAGERLAGSPEDVLVARVTGTAGIGFSA